MTAMTAMIAMTAMTAMITMTVNGETSTGETAGAVVYRRQGRVTYL